jgi:hypothetical protein
VLSYGLGIKKHKIDLIRFEHDKLLNNLMTASIATLIAKKAQKQADYELKARSRLELAIEQLTNSRCRPQEERKNEPTGDVSASASASASARPPQSPIRALL